MKVPEPKKLPSGNYRVQVCIDGQKISITRPTAKECKREAEYLKAQQSVGIGYQKKKEITTQEAISKYIDNRTAVLSPSTIRGYRVIEKNYFQSAMRKKLSDVDWQKEVNEMAKNHAPKTVRNAWRFVVSVLSEYGIEAKKIALPMAEKKERNFLDIEQVKLFVSAIKGTEIEIPALLGLHSLRRSEIAALDWEHIDLKAKTISVKGALVPNEENELIYKKTNKNDASTRTIPIMIPDLLDALESVKEKKGRVCKMHPNSLYKAVNTICDKNGLPRVGVHGLRHSAISLFYFAGLSEMQSMMLGGYSDYYTMRKVYTHLDRKAADDAMSKIMRIFN